MLRAVKPSLTLSASLVWILLAASATARRETTTPSRRFGVTQINSQIRGGSTQPSYFGARSPAKPSGPRQGSTPVSSIIPPREADDVSTKEMIDSFLTRDSRTTFIARVYAILGVQLTITASTIVLFGLHPFLSTLPLQIAKGQYQGALTSIPLVGVLVSTVAWFRVCSSPEARQKSPNKWWWLGIFTVGESLSIAFLTSMFKFQSVVVSMGATAVATFAVSAFTILQKNPKYDLSQWGATLSSWALILLAYLFVGMFQQIGWIPAGLIPYSSMMYSFFAACLFSAFLAYHTKLIVGGKHSKYRLSEKDYVLGSMALYADITSIFLNLLQLLGSEKE